MPDTIQKFSDIKLRDYSKKPGCQPPSSLLKEKYTLNKKDELYVKYAENIKKMIQTAADNQYKLLDVINELFTYVKDPYSGKRVIRINPKLTDLSLQKAVEKTRKLIIDLYIKCESDYLNGVQIFEAIVESKIIETTQKQIETLKKEASKIISDTKKASKPTQNEPVIIVGNNTSSTPITNTSSTPITNTSTTPITNTSTTPITNNSSTPITNTSSTPITNTSSTPITNTSTTPITNTSSTMPVTNTLATIPTNTSTTIPVASNISSPIPYSTNQVPTSIVNNPTTSIQNTSIPISSTNNVKV
jgi:hypothetical protein